MISRESKAVARKAKELYESKLCDRVERKHSGKYARIEPLSESYFLGDTFDEAVNAALDAFPGRLTHTLKIGHSAALHLGVLRQ